MFEKHMHNVTVNVDAQDTSRFKSPENNLLGVSKKKFTRNHSTKQIQVSKLTVQSKGTSKAKSKSPQRSVSNASRANNLQELFENYAGPTNEIDGKTFAKITRDAGVINRYCTLIDIDIIFAKVKQKAMRKINYNQFRAAIDLCAAKRGQSTKSLAD